MRQARPQLPRHPPHPPPPPRHIDMHEFKEALHMRANLVLDDELLKQLMDSCVLVSLRGAGRGEGLSLFGRHLSFFASVAF